MNIIISKIKEKKSLANLEDSYIQYFLNKFLVSNQSIRKKYVSNKLKEKDIEKIVKGVRNKLNKTYGQFWLDNLDKLESHKSTKERINNYSRIYSEIFKIINVPKVLLDISAGLNPLSYNFIGNNTYFIASELTKFDCKILSDFFKKENIKGEVIKLDLFNYKSLPDSDVCFLFKILDLFDNYKLAEKLIQDIPAKYLVVSFSTIDVRNRRMNYPRRGWFERMIERLNYKMSKFETNNEIFYIVKKN